MYVLARETDRERERERGRERERERKREKERERDGGHSAASCVCVCVCVCACSLVSLCANCHMTLFPSRLELMVKLRTLCSTVFPFVLKAKAWDYGKGRYIFDLCLWCSSNHIALCQLANQSRLCLLEGGTL